LQGILVSFVELTCVTENRKFGQLYRSTLNKKSINFKTSLNFKNDCILDTIGLDGITKEIVIALFNLPHWRERVNE